MTVEELYAWNAYFRLKGEREEKKGGGRGGGEETGGGGGGGGGRRREGGGAAAAARYTHTIHIARDSAEAGRGRGTSRGYVRIRDRMCACT